MNVFYDAMPPRQETNDVLRQLVADGLRIFDRFVQRRGLQKGQLVDAADKLAPSSSTE